MSLLAPIPAMVLTALLAAIPPAPAATVEIQALGRDGKPLPETVIFLESAAAKAAVRPLGGVEIEQLNKRFTQRVTVVPVGSAVDFPNRDTVRHHVYSFSPVKTFELKLYIGKPENPVLFDRVGIAVLGCNIHDTMIAWVVVVDTPYHGQSAAEGRIRLTDVPPGTYRLRSWHPDLPVGAPALDQAIVVGADGATASVRLPLTAPPG
jgi:plastocyanin